MAALTVGQTQIPYTIRRSNRAKRRRIEVTPESVVLVVPQGGDLPAARKFLESRRAWVFTQLQVVNAKAAHRDAYRPERLVTGAKVYYRGRRTRLTVRIAKDDRVRVEYRNGFVLHAPANASEQAKRRALIAWLKNTVREDVEALVRRYTKSQGASASGLRVKALEGMWGSCGTGGILHFDWRLVFAPRPVLEYAVLHEVCHLTERTHSRAFWSTLRAQMPNFEERKAWLDEHQHLLDALPL